MKHKIIIADDHKLVRRGLSRIINDEIDLEVIAEASTGEEVVELASKINPEIIIMDFNMPGINGIDATEKILLNNNKIKILLLTMHESEALVMDALSSGINGFLYKDADMEELLTAIRSILNGKDYFNEEIKQKILNFHRTRKKDSMHHELDKKRIPITKREIEIVSLIGKGLSSAEIAEHLFISVYTVIKHRKNVLKKLGFKNFAEVVLYLKENNLI